MRRPRTYHRGVVLDRTIIYNNYAMKDERNISGPQSELAERAPRRVIRSNFLQEKQI